ncbi:hypothetical protein BV898_16582 [Hypsibius exemplaris]|uniref:Uncharacterized protein n=1 Tax=Hypsibius exemplaris TaxID=2072580 RepID=A0A9X6NKG0_HYPEX|nr:hypothetical protein BV898_16582 [Hypsibius exemplaris]
MRTGDVGPAASFRTADNATKKDSEVMLTTLLDRSHYDVVVGKRVIFGRPAPTFTFGGNAWISPELL